MPATRAPRRRPRLVWVVFLWYVFSAGYTVLSFALIWTGAVPLTDDASRYLSSLSLLDYAVTALALLLNVSGAIALLMLRRVALYLFVSAFALSAMLVVLHASTKGFVSALGAGGPIGLIVGYAISALVCLYAWRLAARGTLT